MRLNLRVILKSYLMLVISYIIVNICKGESINKIILITGILVSIYVVLTIDIDFEKNKIKKLKNINELSKEYKDSLEFKQIYYKFLGIYSSKLEKLRKCAIFSKILEYCCLVFMIFAFIKEFEELVSGVIIVIFSFLLYLSFRMSTYNIMEKYKKVYKQETISKFIKEINPVLEYNEFGDRHGIDMQYKLSRLEYKSYDFLKADDIISGQISDDTYIDIANICVVKFNKEISRNYEQKLFEGMFSAARSTVNTKGFMKIVKQVNDDEDNLSDKKVNLDSEMFERIYNVYSPDKIFVLRILTPDVMEMLTEFGKYDFNVEISIRENMIYTRIGLGAMFEPGVFVHSLDRNVLYTYYRAIKFVSDLTETINESLKEFVS